MTTLATPFGLATVQGQNPDELMLFIPRAELTDAGKQEFRDRTSNTIIFWIPRPQDTTDANEEETLPTLPTAQPRLF